MNGNMSHRAVSSAQMLAFDRFAIEQLGVPSLILMENAGRGLAEEILRSLKNKRNVLIVCGTGNNGGDGLVSARHLLVAGIEPKVFLVGKEKDLKKDPEVNFEILKKLGIKIFVYKKLEFQRAVKKSDVIVDALFGVGLNRNIGEPFCGVIEVLNRSKKKIISADVPSGLDATSGKIHGVCVKAHKTVAFSFAKKGFYKNHGPKVTGKVSVVSLGVPFRSSFNVRRST